MQIDLVDLMRKQHDGSLIWVEAVGNIEIAKNRINDFGRTAPGEYVIFDQSTQQVVASVVTDAMPPAATSQNKARRTFSEERNG